MFVSDVCVRARERAALMRVRARERVRAALMRVRARVCVSHRLSTRIPHTCPSENTGLHQVTSPLLLTPVARTL